MTRDDQQCLLAQCDEMRVRASDAARILADRDAPPCVDVIRKQTAEVALIVASLAVLLHCVVTSMPVDTVRHPCETPPPAP